MKFIWPEMLWLAMLLPLLVLAYIWLMRRRKVVALRFANLALVREALGRTSTWRRHVPPVLLLLAFGAFVLAAGRPVAVLTLPTQQQTILMVMDVSGSMRATDVAPDRALISRLQVYEARPAQNSLMSLAITGFATSIDAMAVGASLAFVNVNIWPVAAAIGLATFIMVTLGVMVGRVLGAVAGRLAEAVGGVVLVGIGAAILYEHLSAL